MKINENSLFALLLRSPWWASALVALGLAGGLRLLIPDMFAIFSALPFAGIAVYVGYRQLRAPSEASIAKTLEGLRAAPAAEFAEALAEAFRRDGYTVKPLAGEAADLEAVKGWRTTLVACRRWKATRTGTEPLRELEAARARREAQDCVYVAAGEVTAQAREFAAAKNIRLIEGAELAGMLRRAASRRGAQ